MFPRGETVTVLRGVPIEDPYSAAETVLDWTVPGETPVPGCAVAPRESVEPEQVGRSSVIVGLTVFMPAGTAVTAADRLRIRGQVHEIVGEPGDWRSPFTGRAHGIEVATRQVSG